MLMKFIEILVSQGAIQGGSSSARSFDLARPGVAPPLPLIQLGGLGSGSKFPAMVWAEPGRRTCISRLKNNAHHGI